MHIIRMLVSLFTRDYLRFLLFGPFREISACFSNRLGSSGEIYGYNLVPTGEFRLENLRGGRKQTGSTRVSFILVQHSYTIDKSDTCDSVPSCNLVTIAYSGRSIILNSSWESLTAAARTNRVDFLPNLRGQ